MSQLFVLVMFALIACPAVTFAGDTRNEAQVDTVKSGKSNSSERRGTPGDTAGDTAQPNAGKSGGKPKGGERPDSGSGDRTTVKSGKSNSSD